MDQGDQGGRHTSRWQTWCRAKDWCKSAMRRMSWHLSSKLMFRSTLLSDLSLSLPLSLDSLAPPHVLSHSVNHQSLNTLQKLQYNQYIPSKRQVMDANPKQLEEFRGGKVKLLGFFQGQCMKASQGRVNPTLLNDLLPKMLSGEVTV